MAQVANLEEDHEMQTMQAQAADEAGRKSTQQQAGGESQQPQTASIYVGNLDLRATEQDLESIFSVCGTIVRVTIVKDRFTSQSRGHGFIEFESSEAASRALSKDNQTLHGRPMKVTPKRENVPGHMRGGGGHPGAAGGVPGFLPGRGGRGGFRGGAGGPPNAMMGAMAQMMSAMASQFMGGGAGAPRGGRGSYRGSGGRGGRGGAS